MALPRRCVPPSELHPFHTEEFERDAPRLLQDIVRAHPLLSAEQARTYYDHMCLAIKFEALAAAHSRAQRETSDADVLKLVNFTAEFPRFPDVFRELAALHLSNFIAPHADVHEKALAFCGVPDAAQCAPPMHDVYHGNLPDWASVKELMDAETRAMWDGQTTQEQAAVTLLRHAHGIMRDALSFALTDTETVGARATLREFTAFMGAVWRSVHGGGL